MIRSVGARLLAGVLMILLLMVAIGGLAIYNLGVERDLTADLYAHEFAGMRAVERARAAAITFRVQTLLSVSAVDAAERDQILARRREAGTLFDQEIAALQSLLRRAEHQELLRQVQAAWARYTTVADQVLAAAAGGDRSEAERLMHTTGRQEAEELDSLLASLSEAKSTVAASAAQRAARVAESGRNLTLGFLLGALLVGAGITWRLRHLTGVIRGTTQDLAATTAELLASVTQQEASTTGQAAAVSQTTATVDEVRVTAQQASQRAHEVAARAREAAQTASQGLDAVESSVAGIQDVRGRVESIAEQILALSEQTQQVGEIITAVDELADRSNLLAVNAAIEAARAGEQGRGFAVVAAEVRSLAERSKAATVQVRTILTDIQRSTNAAVLATEQGTKGAEEGARLVERAGQTIRQLAETIQDAAEAAQQILASAGQQGVGMDQIALAMADINQATAETAAGTRQLQKATENMDSLAQRLSDLVGQSRRNGRV